MQNTKYKWLMFLFSAIIFLSCLYLLTNISVYAASDMWTLAKKIIKDVYKNVAGISTVLAGLMSAISVIGAKMSNNQQKVDQAWDWLKRVWIAWVVINGIGAFLAYIVPLFDGYATLSY